MPEDKSSPQQARDRRGKQQEDDGITNKQYEKLWHSRKAPRNERIFLVESSGGWRELAKHPSKPRRDFRRRRFGRGFAANHEHQEHFRRHRRQRRRRHGQIHPGQQLDGNGRISVLKLGLACLVLFQYSVLVSSLAKRAKSVIRDLDPTNELRYLRMRSRKHEVSERKQSCSAISASFHPGVDRSR